MFERFHREARAAVVLAQEEARELLAAEIAPGHLLLGVLRGANRDLSGLLSGYGLSVESVRARLADDGAAPLSDDDAAALRSIGIDLDKVRDQLARAFGANALDWAGARGGGRGRRRGRIPLTRSAKKVLELALREAIARKDNWIGCEHILLGMLRGGDDVAITLLTKHVDGRQLRTELIAMLDEAA